MVLAAMHRRSRVFKYAPIHRVLAFVTIMAENMPLIASGSSAPSACNLQKPFASAKASWPRQTQVGGSMLDDFVPRANVTGSSDRSTNSKGGPSARRIHSWIGGLSCRGVHFRRFPGGIGMRCLTRKTRSQHSKGNIAVI